MSHKHRKPAGRRKGQINSLDLIIATSAFFIALITITLVWASVNSSISERNTRRELADSALVAANQLLTSSGDPANWSIGQFGEPSSIGLVRERNVLNDQKAAKLQNLSATKYAEIKEILGCGRNELHISILTLNETAIYSFGSVAPIGAENFTMNHVVTRMAILNSTGVFVRVEAWNVKR